MAITRDQLSNLFNTASIGAGTTFTITFGTLPTAGSSVIAAIGINGQTVSSVKDNGTVQSTFTQDITQTGSANHISYLFRADGISLPSSGSYTLTVTIGGSGSGVSVSAGAASYQGKAAGAPVSSNGGTATGTSVTTGNATPLFAGSLFAATFQDNSSGTADNPTVTNGNFTSRLAAPNGAAGQVFGLADAIEGGTSADACTWSVGTSATYSAVIAVYSPAVPLGGSGTPVPQTGSQFYDRFFRRTQVLSLGPQVLNVAAGLATGAGAAQGPDYEQMPQLSTATGSAPDVASGLGTELTPALPTGAAPAQPPAIGLLARLATATGNAPSPQPSFGADPVTQAQATGSAITVPLSQSGLGVPPQPGSQQYRRFWHRSQISPLAPTPPVSQALIVSGFGTFPQVPAGSVVLSVIANVTTFGSDTQTSGSSYELWDGTTAVIGVQQGTASTSSTWVDSVVFTGVSYSQLATLQLHIYARSVSGNHGATVSVDAASLSVVWLAVQPANPAPKVLSPKVTFPKATVSVGTTVSPAVLAVVPVVQAATAGLLAASIFPGVLATKAVFPKATLATGMTASPAVLAVVPVQQAITDVTAASWATAESDGGWTNPQNVTGSPDGQYAVWTVP